MQIDPMEFYKMADCCRPEVDSDVISDQKVGTIQVNIVTKFEGPSSNRLGAIKFAHGRYDDGDDDGVRVSCHYALNQLKKRVYLDVHFLTVSLIVVKIKLRVSK